MARLFRNGVGVVRRLTFCCGAAFLLTGLYAQTEPTLQIRALRYELRRTPNGHLEINLAGKVAIEYQGRVLEGEAFALDTEQERVQAQAPFRFIAPEGVLQGERLDYFYAQGRGRFEGVAAEVLGVYLRAAVLEGDLADFVAQEASVATCDPVRPPIQVQAARVRLRDGARLTISSTRLALYGRTVLTLPQLTLRVRETAEVLSLPSPVYSRETGWGVRTQLELPLQANAEVWLSNVSYLRALPETRFVAGIALGQGVPSLGEPDLRLRFELSALYNLRASSERGILRRAPTLRLEYSTDVRPLLAPRERLRLSRREVGLSLPLRARKGFGELSVRYGTLSECVDTQRSPTYERVVLEGEWFQPLWTTSALQLRLCAWGSVASYVGARPYLWIRPQVELLGQPSSALTLMMGYAHATTQNASPILSEQLQARRELSLRAEYRRGNARLGALLKYDLEARELYDVQLLVGWRDRCIEPYLFWRRDPSAVLVGLTLSTLRQ
ncbi:MAG: hypothetical protein NZ550_03990 [Fimbriimonadales bacterium]|nr:hypothetical protein [Fimbriimonadales bacterium]MDW8051479.1 hypothetical protein [Armatimonadota bacterium]